MKKDEPRGKRSAIVVAVIAMTFLPVLYVLSIGPAAWLERNGYLEDSTLHDIVTIFYFPIAWLYDQSATFATLLDAYMNFWD